MIFIQDKLLNTSSTKYIDTCNILPFKVLHVHAKKAIIKRNMNI